MTALKNRRPLTDVNATDNVVALHCSLSSGQQWSQLVETCAGICNAVAPDLSGYGSNPPCRNPATSRLDAEAEPLSRQLEVLAGPVHFVGHSFGGAIAFKLATSERLAHRVRSLTLIEPVLPTILLERDADRPLYDLFAAASERICAPIWSGEKELALQRFLAFWNGPGCWDLLSSGKKSLLMERVTKLVGDFSAIFAERDTGEAARRLAVPTLLISGGASPQPSQRMARRLAATMPNARHIHLPLAGHMLAITHSSELNPRILRHVMTARG
ncbi:alpha/beta fold hydrolase [Bradyrhizobium lablabi]|uniref:alpha/beta fold hydrolase n=1 Tax=Bradyrhizobium lablabi TaxID=722472 RepID=UPI001BAB4762|nr:alpha/beta fold hydrolase [Bradyrhizobium lablabi]MBR1122833.1 alpha/beta fold hydrolase [Bradyrhizobium lablabi]